MQVWGQSTSSVLAESFPGKGRKIKLQPFLFSKAVLCPADSWEMLMTNIFFIPVSPATALVCTQTADTSWHTDSQICRMDQPAFLPASWEASGSDQWGHKISWNNQGRVKMWKTPTLWMTNAVPKGCFLVWIPNSPYSPLYNYRYSFVSLYLPFMRSFKFAKNPSKKPENLNWTRKKNKLQSTVPKWSLMRM